MPTTRPDDSAPDGAPIRLVVADDHQLLRDGLVGLLSGEADFAVVGVAANGREALEAVAELRPDVALLDVTMPDMNGVEAARRISRDYPEVRVLALSMHTENRFVTEMFQAGAAGYVLKMCDFTELAEAVRTVAAGGNHVSSQIAGAVIKNLAGRLPSAASPDGLSDREREVLQLLADGKSSKESAAILHVSVKTIDTHRRQIMQKLGIDSVAELTKHAIRQGLTPL